jgi:uncharacterized phage protein (TIGR02218 family)
MKNISSALHTHLNGEVLTLAHCWKITRRDTVVMGFTDHDQPLIIDDVTYAAATGFTPTAIRTTGALDSDNLDISGMLSAEAITREDILAGIYDFAEVMMFIVNYNDLSAGHIVVRYGWLGEVRLQGEQFVAELYGLTQKLNNQLGEIYSPTCRAELGDTACGVNLISRTVSGSITAVGSATVLYDTSRLEEAGRYTHGMLHFTSGANAGISMEVKSYTPQTIRVMLPLPYGCEIGDNYTLTEGCDKRFATCKTRFNNAINFRGEPYLIGIDRMLETSSTRNG